MKPWVCPTCGTANAPWMPTCGNARCGQGIPLGKKTLGKDATCSYCGGAMWVCRGRHVIV